MDDAAADRERTALVLGATGGLGAELTRQLLAAGWRVRALHRRPPDCGAQADTPTWFRGDALHAEDVHQAAQGCSVIVHATNPPAYRGWRELALPMLANTIAAATAQQATIVFPGNLYNYGSDAFLQVAEDAPQHPHTRKGAIRVEMERMLQAATTQGARAIVVRAGDFFGPRVSGNSWFVQTFVRPGQPVGLVLQPGRAGVGHQWAYLPDLARTIVLLLGQRVTLAPFARFHMAGHWDADGTQMVASILRIAREHGLKPRTWPLPWPAMRLAAPFSETIRETLEMRYLWQESIHLDNTRLRAVLGQEPHTPWDDAVRTTLAALGCIHEHAEAFPAPGATR